MIRWARERGLLNRLSHLPRAHPAADRKFENYSKFKFEIAPEPCAAQNGARRTIRNQIKLAKEDRECPAWQGCVVY